MGAIVLSGSNAVIVGVGLSASDKIAVSCTNAKIKIASIMTSDDLQASASTVEVRNSSTGKVTVDQCSLRIDLSTSLDTTIILSTAILSFFSTQDITITSQSLAFLEQVSGDIVVVSSDSHIAKGEGITVSTLDIGTQSSASLDQSAISSEAKGSGLLMARYCTIEQTTGSLRVLGAGLSGNSFTGTGTLLACSAAFTGDLNAKNIFGLGLSAANMQVTNLLSAGCSGQITGTNAVVIGADTSPKLVNLSAISIGAESQLNQGLGIGIGPHTIDHGISLGGDIQGVNVVSIDGNATGDAVITIGGTGSYSTGVVANTNEALIDVGQTKLRAASGSTQVTMEADVTEFIADILHVQGQPRPPSL